MHQETKGCNVQVDADRVDWHQIKETPCVNEEIERWERHEAQLGTDAGTMSSVATTHIHTHLRIDSVHVYNTYIFIYLGNPSRFRGGPDRVIFHIFFQKKNNKLCLKCILSHFRPCFFQLFWVRSLRKFQKKVEKNMILKGLKWLKMHFKHNLFF